MRPLRLALFVVLAVVAAACASGAGDDLARDGSTDGTAGSAPSPPSPEEASTTTTTAGLPQAGPLPPSGDCPAVPAQAPPDPARPRYAMDVRVLPGLDAVDGRLTVRFSPDLPTDRLVFRLWPNGPRPAAAGAHLDAGPVFLGSSAPVATSQPDPTTLVVPLDPPLQPGEAVEATVPWRLTLPGPSNDRLAVQDGAVRLGSFFPILAWEPGVGWALEPATSVFGEASTAPVADFSYSVTVPDGLSVLASGVPEAGRWEALAVRDVAVSVGRFRTAEGVAHAPWPVKVTVGVHDGLDDDAGAYLDRVVRSMEDFSRRFGPYPYPAHTLALTPGLSGGLEYPGHVMQGPGTIGRTTSHEVAHLWFYSLVGNNQGRDPWIDEGLATWAEARFEGSLAEVAGKGIPAPAQGRAGEPMTYWETHQDSYYRGTYVQPAQALAALGDPDRVDCALRHFVATNAFGVARSGDVVAALARVFPEAPGVLAGAGISP
ncbi:MAG TPA: hypothetical protein VGV63_04590 [Acidimicrobiales bacterium]|nr:hypothetical protein [Acidimicrobiales bacterium]